MADLAPSTLLDALKWRYATKTFDPDKKIPDDLWDTLEQALVLTPSSFGLQPWKFRVILNPEIRQQLRAQSWGQSQVTDASHLVVITTKTDLVAADIGGWVDRLAEVQGAPREVLRPLEDVIDGFVAGMSSEQRAAWNARQAYIALGQLMTAAALLGLDSCPMEGISPLAYDKVLGLEGSGYTTIVVCAVGYRSPNDTSAARPKARYDRSDIIDRVL